MHSEVEHKGFVESIEKNHIKVRIVSQSACASCHAKGACTTADMQDKIIDVTNFHESYEVGEPVKVVLQQSLGFKALFLGYVLPFLLILITLIISISITRNEGLSGLLSLGILVPYYFILALNKEKLKKSFSFTIKKTI